MKKKKHRILNTQGKILNFPSHGNNLSLLNFNSGISNNSNSLLLNNSFSFNKNNNSKISLDDSFSLTGIFSTPLSELNESEENKKNIPKFQFPTILKCVQNKKKKSFERFKDKFFGSQPNIKKYLKIEDKKNEKEEVKEIKEIRNMVNSSFYENEKDINIKKKDDKNKNLKKEKNSKYIEKKDIKKNGNILIYKTPNKNDKENQDENKQNNFDISRIKKNWGLLFSQNAVA